MELLKIEFGFQPRSKSGVQSEVQSEVQKVVQSYCLGWHFQTCYQKIVGKRFFYNIWTQEGQKYHIIWYKLVSKCCCCRRYCCFHCCSCSFSCCCRCQNRCALVAVVVVVVPVVSSLPFWNQFVSNMWYFCLHCIQILKKSRTYYFLTSPFKVWNEKVTLDLT